MERDHTIEIPNEIPIVPMFTTVYRAAANSTWYVLLYISSPAVYKIMIINWFDVFIKDLLKTPYHSISKSYVDQ